MYSSDIQEEYPQFSAARSCCQFTEGLGRERALEIAEQEICWIDIDSDLLAFQQQDGEPINLLVIVVVAE